MGGVGMIFPTRFLALKSCRTSLQTVQCVADADPNQTVMEAVRMDSTIDAQNWIRIDWEI